MSLPLITPPSAQVNVVTDLDLLRDTVQAANRLGQLPDITGSMTEREIAANRRERERLTSLLSELKTQTDEHTITLTLTGLRANEWNQTVLRATVMEKNKPVKDLPKLLRLSLPLMVTHVADSTGTAIETTASDLEAFADSLTDTQTLELLQAIQELNTPVTNIPKEVLTLLEPANSPT